MTTILKLGPADHGLPMTLEEFRWAECEEGYQYELIDGRLYVTHQPDPPQDIAEKWLFMKVWLYARRHPEVVNYVTNKARVYVKGRSKTTNPEPDLAAYRNFPLESAFEDIHWQAHSPLVVGEVLSAFDPKKDLVRNVELYLQVPSIKEYWLVDNRAVGDRPKMTVYRRHGGRWRPIEVAFGETYTTKLLPGFRLVIDPRK